MFENGSYLRRRKRFKTMKKEVKKSDEQDKSMITKKSITKTSFLIDNLLANDTSTNTSFATSSSSPSSSETTNHTLQKLLYTTDFDLIRHLTFHQHHPQQFYW
jgi:hypothetical protein